MLRPNVCHELAVRRNQTTGLRKAQQQTFLCHWSLCSLVFMAICASLSNPESVSLCIIPLGGDPGKEYGENKFRTPQINRSTVDEDLNNLNKANDIENDLPGGSWTSHLGFLSRLPTFFQKVIKSNSDTSNLGEAVIHKLFSP